MGSDIEVLCVLRFSVAEGAEKDGRQNSELLVRYAPCDVNDLDVGLAGSRNGVRQKLVLGVMSLATLCPHGRRKKEVLHVDDDQTCLVGRNRDGHCRREQSETRLDEWGFGGRRVRQVKPSGWVE